jgi:putative transposase
MPRYHGSDLRLGRISEPGRIYHITAVTSGRTPLFSELVAARCLIGVLRDVHEAGLASTLAFVVMPDHLHWLMQLGDARTLSQVMGTVKSLSARRLGRGSIWQRGFHDHAVRVEEDLVALARYIVANPLRAGLVTRVGDYPHWDAAWL